MKKIPLVLLTLLCGFCLLVDQGLAQENPAADQPEDEQEAEPIEPIAVTIESFIVSMVTGADGTREEQLHPAQEARPGQLVEYQLRVVNQGNVTLPGRTVVLTLPIPEGTRYLEDSATPTSEEVTTEFSADGGAFSEPPVRTVTTGEDGEQREEIVPPEAYVAVRWTLLVPLEPAQEKDLVFRVVVQ